MTVCIASSCQQDKSIVLASDMMVSTVDMSADSAALKGRAIGERWMCLFAGDDISVIEPMIRRIKKHVRMTKDESPEGIADAFVSVFQSTLKQKAENEILRPVGYDFDEFKTNGLHQLGPETFSRLLFDIERLRLDVRFLVAGFDDKGNEEVFTVSSQPLVAAKPAP